MASAELLQAEARERPRMAVVAGVAALFTLAGTFVGRIATGSSPDNLPAGLFFYHEHQVTQYVGGACSVVGVISIALVLDFLFRATRARNPELSSWIRPLVFIGGGGVALFTIAYQISLGVTIEHFATEGSHTYQEARDALEAGVPGYLAVFAQLSLAFAIVVVSVSAMRVGLLTRLVGYLGVVSGALFVLMLLPVPIVQVYWLGMLAVLLIGRTSGGLLPAWRSGEAMPWPSAAEMREARVRAAEERRSGNDDAPAPGAAAGEAPSGPSPATSQRKKRKRR